MTPMDIILDPKLVEEKLIAEGMETGSCTIPTFLLQHEGTEKGNAAAMLIVELPDGTKLLAKTTLRLLEMAVMAARARVGPHVEDTGVKH